MLFYFSNGLVVASPGEPKEERCALHVMVTRAGVGLSLVPTPSPGVAWFSAGNSFFSNKLSISTSIHLQSQYEPKPQCKEESPSHQDEMKPTNV
jgi:hypothetical protein